MIPSTISGRAVFKGVLSFDSLRLPAQESPPLLVIVGLVGVKFS